MRAHAVLESNKLQDAVVPLEGDDANDDHEDHEGAGDHEDHYDPNLFADDHVSSEHDHEGRGNDPGAMQ